MVAPPRPTNRIDRKMWGIAAELSFLPELERDWATETLWNRLDWGDEWGLMMMDLREIDAAYEAGEMSDAQRAAYRDLAHKLLAAGPQLRRLELVMQFPVPLETVVNSQE